MFKAIINFIKGFFVKDTPISKTTIAKDWAKKHHLHGHAPVVDVKLSTLAEAGDLTGLPVETPPQITRDDGLSKAAINIRKVVQSIAPDAGRYYNDKTKNGRSLKWYGTELATVLNNSPKFDNLVRELSSEGINVIVKKTKSATRLHIKRRA